MKTTCPLIRKACAKHECTWYIKLVGKHPQTGEFMEDYDCTFRWLPLLLLENSKQTRETGAAVDKMREENLRMAEAEQKALMDATMTLATRGILSAPTYDAIPLSELRGRTGTLDLARRDVTAPLPDDSRRA